MDILPIRNYVLLCFTRLLILMCFEFNIAQEPPMWNYYGEFGPQSWSTNFPQECASGLWQSPINIQSRNAIKRNFLPLRFFNYKLLPRSMRLFNNNGRTAELSLVSIGRKIPFLSNTPLNNDTFYFLQLHFHWGSVNAQGSEHTINGRRFPLEMHLVHINNKYGRPDIAVRYPDGKLVLSVLFKLQARDNPAFQPLLSSFSRAKNPNTNASVIPFRINSLLPRNKLSWFYYRGSFTSPPCSSGTGWIIFLKPVRISRRQMNTFRRLLRTDGTKGIQDNFRPQQPLRGRPIYYRVPRLVRTYRKISVLELLTRRLVADKQFIFSRTGI